MVIERVSIPFLKIIKKWLLSEILVINYRDFFFFIKRKQEL